MILLLCVCVTKSVDIQGFIQDFCRGGGGALASSVISNAFVCY